MCRTTVFPQLNEFWDILQVKLNNKGPYKVSIGAMYLRLQGLQETDLEVQKIRAMQL